MYFADERSESHEIPGDKVFEHGDVRVRIFSNANEYDKYQKDQIMNRLDDNDFVDW